MAEKTVAVTGGNGTIGAAILAELNEHGYRTVNIARGRQRESISDAYVRTNVLEPGDLYGALGKADADAVVHMATIPGPGSDPGHRVFRSNVDSSYLVLEAAAAFGIDSVVLPSSINVVGTAMQDADPEVEYLPWDEEHPVTPREPYGISKHSLEVAADGFGRAAGPPHSIASLRYPGVNDDEDFHADYVEGDAATSYLEKDSQREDLFAYIHLADGAAIARCAMEADLDGHERFWAVADDTTVSPPTPELVERFWPSVPLRRDFSGHESLISNQKAADLLGWSPEFTWRDL